MYKRFLNNNDYLGIVTEEALEQLIRGNEERLGQAEEAAEASILEYLTENYEVEKELAVGKNIMEYNRQVTYPVGSHFCKNNVIYEALRTINGHKLPTPIPYWVEYTDLIDDKQIELYSQLKNYHPGNIVKFANTLYVCAEYNGLDFNNIRIPGIDSWQEIETYQWQANVEYRVWEVVKWDDKFYALLNLEDVDLTVNPYESDNWGLIGEYDPDYNQYQFSETEYVVLNGKVYVPTMDVNSDELEEGYNIRKHDPRNSNLKKHILRLAIYELHKLISPNNVSSARITDYETSIMWLRDASKLRINPQIPRKLDETNKPITDWQVATFQRDYNPYENPWQI